MSISPSNVILSRRDNVNFTCTTDAGPNNRLIWFKRGQDQACCPGGLSADINGKHCLCIYFLTTDVFIIELLNDTSLIVGNEQTLVLTNINASFGGSYDCLVINDAGYGIDSSILFVVPYFVTHPQNVELEQMQTLTLTCEAEGFPSPSIKWEKMNRVTGMFEAISGENSTVFMINSVAFSDFGMYRCVASNVINDVEYNATSHITAPDHGGLYECIAQNIAGN